MKAFEQYKTDHSTAGTPAQADLQGGMPPIDALYVGLALKNHATELSAHAEKLNLLYSSIDQSARSLGFSIDLPQADWISLSAALLAFRPTLIIELGRGTGASTALFQYWNQVKLSEARIISVCQTSYWQMTALVDDINKVDYEPLLAGQERVLVFWDAHGYSVADTVLGRIVPLLPDDNLIIAHDMRDIRYSGSDSRAYAGKSIWRKQEEPDSLWIHLGTVFSTFEQLVSIVDFCSRNDIEFYSAPHSIASVGDHQIRLEGVPLWHYFSTRHAKKPLLIPKSRPDAGDEKESMVQEAQETSSAEETQPPRFSPAQALWNQRERLASMRPRMQQLYTAVASPSEMSLYQWAQFTATVLEFQPDVIIELGRKAGNSTACFLEAAYQLGPGQCKVISICLEPAWQISTAPRLKPLVPEDWFKAGEIVQGNILTFDFQAALGESKRCLVFWDAHGFEVAECVLGGLLPLLQSREHLVVMHDLSDLRYSSPDPRYGSDGLWKGQNEGQQALWLGWIFSRVAQSIAVLDFTTRNNIQLSSADESIHEELSIDEARVTALQSLLGPEMAALQSHWFWFTLNGAQPSLTFPYFSPQASLKRFEQMSAFETTTNSIGWQLFQRWQRFMRRLAPPGSMRRKMVEYCVRPLRRSLSR